MKTRRTAKACKNNRNRRKNNPGTRYPTGSHDGYLPGNQRFTLFYGG
jgi:hypothetical protein